MKQVAGTLRLDLAQFRELEAFAQFGSDLDEKTRTLIERGRRATEILKQPQYEPLTVEKEVAILYALTRGHLDDIAVADIVRFQEEFSSSLDNEGKSALDLLKKEKALTPEVEESLTAHIAAFKKGFSV